MTQLPETSAEPTATADSQPAAEPGKDAQRPDGITAESASTDVTPEAEVPDGAPVEGSTHPTDRDAAPAASEEAVEADLKLLEALLFATRHPLTAGKLAELLGLETTAPVRRAAKALNDHYVATGRAFRVEHVAGGFQLLTLPEYGETLKKLHQKEADAKLTKAALETLAVVAYKQPILRADIEAIRGVACGETVRSLMEKHLVRIAGRAEVPGRPILYGTTRRFLEIFGLASLKDLPKAEDQPLRPATQG